MFRGVVKGGRAGRGISLCGQGLKSQTYLPVPSRIIILVNGSDEIRLISSIQPQSRPTFSVFYIGKRPNSSVIVQEK